MAEERTNGRVAQRRRTRRAILDAATQLLRDGAEPSVNDIASAADVSRRTVYLYYTTLDQLFLDASIGALQEGVGATLDSVTSDDPRTRLDTLIDQLFTTMELSLPLGRKLVKLTVDAAPPAQGQPRRGHRRVGWIEWVLAPCRASLTERVYADLVSALTLVIGWEAFIALLDVRGLSPERAKAVTVQAAHAILDAVEGLIPETRTQDAGH